MLFFLSIFCLLLAFYSGIQYQRKTQTQIKYIAQEKPITVIPKEDLMKRCGPIPDEIPPVARMRIRITLIEAKTLKFPILFRFKKTK